MNRPRIKLILRLVLAAGMIFVGVTHFTDPLPFVTIMPTSLPYPLELVYISGFFEILGGVGVLIPRVRSLAGWGLIALFVAVFPANINMAINNIQLPGKNLPVWTLWARLPLQLVLIAWAWWCTRPESDHPVR